MPALFLNFSPSHSKIRFTGLKSKQMFLCTSLPGHGYPYTFSHFALETERASTLQHNQGKGHLQVGGFISTRMRNRYFNISMALKR